MSLDPAKARALPAGAAMDAMYRRQRAIYDLTRKYYLLGRDRLIRDLAPGGGHVLEVGCGTGRNLAAAARRHREASFYGFDVSAVMLETAEAAIARAGLAARVKVARADATLPGAAALFGRADFDRVYISYVLSMVPDWRAALDRAADAVAPGGRLLVVDFGRQEGLPASFKRLLLGWLALFHVHPAADLPAALDALAAGRGWRVRRASLYRGYAVYASLERPAVPARDAAEA